MAYKDEQVKDFIKEICERVSSGENINVICQDKHLPNPDTVYRWLLEYQWFADEYARARQNRADVRSDRIDDIVRRHMNGELNYEQARISIDAEKWQAGKENQKRYGNSVLNKHADSDGNNMSLDDVLLFIDGKTKDLPNNHNQSNEEN